MKPKTKDLFMYALFFAVIIMFVFLFFVFFRGGRYNTSSHTADIAEEVLTVKINADSLTVNVYPSENGKAYIAYEKRSTQGDSDELTTSVSNNVMYVTVSRKQGNTLSGLWRGASAVNIYIPDENNLTIDFDIKTGRVTVKNAKLHAVSFSGNAAAVTVKDATLDRIDVGAKAGRLVFDGARITSSKIDVSLCDVVFKNQRANDGFTLYSDIAAGYISSDSSLSIEHPRFPIKYNENIAALGGANKIILKTSLARISIS